MHAAPPWTRAHVQHTRIDQQRACMQSPPDKAADEQAQLSSFESRTVGMAIRHVVLAVHGIGQRMGGRTIAEDAQVPFRSLAVPLSLIHTMLCRVGW